MNKLLINLSVWGITDRKEKCDHDNNILKSHLLLLKPELKCLMINDYIKINRKRLNGLNSLLKNRIKIFSTICLGHKNYLNFP